MPGEWRILYVDDERETVESDIERIERLNAPDNRKPRCVYAPTFDEAEQLLSREVYDLIILDVKDDSGGPAGDDRGRQILETIKNKAFIPVIFHTGWPDHVNDLEGPYVRIVTKSADEDVVDMVDTLLRSKVTQFSRHVSEEIRQYMWHSIEEHGASLGEFNDDEIAHMLSRRLAYRLQTESAMKFLDYDSGSPAPRPMNPIEVYQFPPEAEFRQSGDLLRRKDDQVHESTLYVILTPTCDLVSKKGSRILIAEAQILAEATFQPVKELSEKWHKREQLAGRKKKEFDRELRTFLTQGLLPRIHFLPPTAITGPPRVVDFSALSLVSRDELETLVPVAALDSPFREQLLARYGSFASRVGVPEVNSESILGK
jgi:CheY-like chemotaxis protein